MIKKIYYGLIFLLVIILSISSAQSLIKNINPTFLIERNTNFFEVTGNYEDLRVLESKEKIGNNNENNPPFIPSHPSPGNGSIDQPRVIYFLWLGGDPDGDPVTYDVYFGTSNPPPKVSSNQTQPSYIPGILNYSSTYYWKIVSWDNHSACAVGPIWHFTTILDTIQPFTTHTLNVPLGNEGWYIDDAIITLIALDNQSGINHTYYRFDNNTWIEYIIPIVVSIDGIYSFEYYSVDKVGNIEPVKGPFSLKIDQTPPSISITKQQNSFFEIEFSAEAIDMTSGIDYVWFALDGVLQFNDTQSPYEWICTISGRHTVTVFAFDIAGNAGSQSMALLFVQIQGFNAVQLQIIQQFMELGLPRQQLG